MKKTKQNPATQAAQVLGHLGGTQRAKNLSPEEMSEIAKLGNYWRNQNLTPEQRSELSRKAAEKRWKDKSKS